MSCIAAVYLTTLVTACYRLSTYGRRTFCVAGQSVWNSLPDSLQYPVIGRNSFRQSLKTFLFAMYWCIRGVRASTTMHHVNVHFSYLLTAVDIAAPLDMLTGLDELLRESRLAAQRKLASVTTYKTLVSGHCGQSHSAPISTLQQFVFTQNRTNGPEM